MKLLHCGASNPHRGTARIPMHLACHSVCSPQAAIGIAILGAASMSETARWGRCQKLDRGVSEGTARGLTFDLVLTHANSKCVSRSAARKATLESRVLHSKPMEPKT